jgi:hypothetical protein
MPALLMTIDMSGAASRRAATESSSAMSRTSGTIRSSRLACSEREVA